MTKKRFGYVKRPADEAVLAVEAQPALLAVPETPQAHQGAADALRRPEAYRLPALRRGKPAA